MSRGSSNAHTVSVIFTFAGPILTSRSAGEPILKSVRACGVNGFHSPYCSTSVSTSQTKPTGASIRMRSVRTSKVVMLITTGFDKRRGPGLRPLPEQFGRSTVLALIGGFSDAAAIVVSPALKRILAGAHHGCLRTVLRRKQYRGCQRGTHTMENASGPRSRHCHPRKVGVDGPRVQCRRLQVVSIREPPLDLE